jgi:nucleoid-associated protein YgaU
MTHQPHDAGHHGREHDTTPEEGAEHSGHGHAGRAASRLRSRAMSWLKLEREARFGIAVVLSFAILVTVFLVNKSRNKSGKTPPVAEISASTGSGDDKKEPARTETQPEASKTEPKVADGSDEKAPPPTPPAPVEKTELKLTGTEAVEAPPASTPPEGPLTPPAPAAPVATTESGNGTSGAVASAPPAAPEPALPPPTSAAQEPSPSTNAAVPPAPVQTQAQAPPPEPAAPLPAPAPALTDASNPPTVAAPEPPTAQPTPSPATPVAEAASVPPVEAPSAIQTPTLAESPAAPTGGADRPVPAAPPLDPKPEPPPSTPTQPVPIEPALPAPTAPVPEPTAPPASSPASTPAQTPAVDPTRAGAVPSFTPSPASDQGQGGWVAIPNGGKKAASDETAVKRDRVITPEIEPAAAPGTAPAPRDSVEPVPHIVQQGENFWTISRLYYGSGRYYKALWKANSQIVERPEKLYIRTKLRIPPPEELDPSLIEPPKPTPAPPNSVSERAEVPVHRAARPVGHEETAGQTTRPASETEVALPVGDPFTAGETSPVDDPSAATRESRYRPRYPVYKVRRYDTLRSIARNTLGDSRRADEILELNRTVIDDPGHLISGQLLDLPEDAQIGGRSR